MGVDSGREGEYGAEVKNGRKIQQLFGPRSLDFVGSGMGAVATAYAVQVS